MPKNSGFSLVELIISLAMSVVLGLAFLSLVRQFNDWNANLGLLLERDERLRQAPLLLSRQLASAGNNRFAGSWKGLEWGSSVLRARSDLVGDRGFPDGELWDAFESITLRCNNGNLQIRSGRGRFQPLLKNISNFSVLSWSPPFLKVRVAAETGRELRQAGDKALEEIDLAFVIWNYHPALFEEFPP